MERQVDILFKILRGGADYAILRAEGEPVIRCRRGAELKMSLLGDFQLTAVDADGHAVSVDWINDEIAPILVIDGEERQIGVFASSKAPETDDDGVKSIRVQAYDRCWRVQTTKAETPVYFAAGTNYLTAIEQLLVTAGINDVLKTDKDATFATDREDLTVGMSYLEYINKLLDEINYKPLWFNFQGTAVLEPVSVPTAANIRHNLTDRIEPMSGTDAELITRLIGRKIVKDTDMYNAPNVWICVCQNPDLPAPLRAVAENNNADSPLSTVNRGRRIVEKVNVDNISSQTELQAYADRLRDQSLISTDTLELETALIPGFGVDDVVGVSLEGDSFLAVDREWTMELTVGGAMTHTMEIVRYNIE